MLVPMLTVFAVVAALAFAIERIDPARPQPIFRRAFLTDCVYCVTSIAVRALDARDERRHHGLDGVEDAGARLARLG